jgi:integrase
VNSKNRRKQPFCVLRRLDISPIVFRTNSVRNKSGEKSMAVDLSRVGDRDKLKAKREPYWQRLRVGCFLGFRPSKRGGKGNWIARVYDEDAAKYRLKALGDFGTLAGNEIFASAKKEAEALAELIEAGGEIRPALETVGEACRSYAAGKPEAQGRFERYVYNEPLAKVKLAKLRRRHLADWRARLEARPSVISRNKHGETRSRKRAPSTVNRDMVVLRAALMKVLPPGPPNTEAAWQEALKAIPNADGARTLYLDIDQRRLLVEHVSAEAEPFVRGLCLLPFRPGALANLTCANFDKRTSELTIGKDKDGRPRRILVPEEAADLFSSQAVGKNSEEPLFLRTNGKAWDRDSWKVPIAKAAALAGLPGGTTAYTLRHSTITDLVIGGLPLLTVAQISGTSAEMIERHYGHLVRNAALKALSALAL